VHTLVTATAGQVDVRLEGTLVLSKPKALCTNGIGRVQLGDDTTARPYDIIYDDVVVDRSAIVPDVGAAAEVAAATRR